MKTKYIITLIILSLAVIPATAQDIHFSQFNNAPLSLNPATTGAFNGVHRISANYKSQWQSIDKTYLTYGLSYDAGLLRGRLNGGIFGIGIQVYHDVSGANKMGLTQENLSIAYHLPLSRSNMLSVGIQGGFTQRSLNPDEMQWGSQYDPTAANGYNPNQSAGTSLAFGSYNFGEVSAGLLYTFNKAGATLSSQDVKKFQLGIALYHINQPKQTYFDIKDKRLFMKMAVHANGFFGFKNTNVAFVPSAVWYHQGPCNEILAGTLFRFNLRGSSRYTGFVRETALLFGGYYRVNDAVIAAMQFEWNNFLLGVSYDINTSGLSGATRYAGGVEVALRYQFPLPDVKNNSLF